MCVWMSVCVCCADVLQELSEVVCGAGGGERAAGAGEQGAQGTGAATVYIPPPLQEKG